MFSLEYILISLPILLITITIHEFAHAKVADMLGDPTPRAAGRLTLNPISHIDPIGFLMLFVFRFGWAKPVPINPYNFADPRKGSAFVGLAGPVSNLFVAWLIAMFIKFSPLGGLDFSHIMFVFSILSYAIWINIALAIFNLIPIPPLDGSHILEAVLPYEQAQAMHDLRNYGFLILVMLIYLPPTQYALVFMIDMIYGLLLR